MNIDQDKLCEYCNDKKSDEYASNTLCEGRWCEETRTEYMEEHGLTEEVTSFGQIKPGDSVYIISDDEIKVLEIESLLLKTNSIEMIFDKHCIAVSNNENVYESNGVFVLLDKKAAIEKYESIMTEKIKSMAIMLANFQ